MTAQQTAEPHATSAAVDIDQLSINTIRTLAIDAVEKAASGHAGAPMALAPVAYTLWRRFLNYDPDQPHWPNRDRFVLSNGHASMLLYSLIHLAGIKRFDRHGKPLNQPAVSLEDIENFRELGGVCAGHPEFGLTTGVETTTGPLGQGVSNSVGMALAGRWLAARYNTADAKLFDYNVYAICSDGDLMEGVASEAASIAGHLRLSNLCWIWDDNEVTIEGHTEIAFTEDVAARFRGYGWATRVVDDANDCESFARAIESFQSTDDRPTLIVVKSVIGYGSPHKQGTSKAHSDPLGGDEVKLTKAAYGWPIDAQFLVPDGVEKNLSDAMRDRGGKARRAWDETIKSFGETAADKSKELKAIFESRPPEGWEAAIPVFPPDAKGVATRESSGKVLNAIAQRWPWLIGGSADLGSSNKTLLEFEGASSFEPGTYSGRNLHFGVREHAMGSIANGMSVSGLRAYTGTFFTFSDYMKPPIRLAALMETPTAFVFSHDSIGIGQDGPTHQPIEQLVALRAVPGLIVVRPADANETAEAWRAVLSQTEQPACMIFSRQATPTLDRQTYASAEGLRRGAYVLAGDQASRPEVILIATGAEVDYAIKAHERLVADGVKSRVVSMPCWSWFEEQDKAYRDAVLPPDVTSRVVIEAASPIGWDRYAGASGEIIAMRSFGASAPAGDLFKHFGFTVDHVVEAARAQISGAKSSPSATSGSSGQSTQGGAHQ